MSKHYSVSADRSRRDDGLTRIWDESSNAYVADEAGEILTFPLPYDAQCWIERDWLRSIGIEA